MSSRANYTPREWKKLHELTSAIPFYLLKTDFSFFRAVGKLKEGQAFIEFVQKIQDMYPSNKLIKSLFQVDVNHEGKTNSPNLIKLTGASAMDYFGDLIAECNQILNEKSDEKEAGELKAAVYQIATTVASASGDGFFGGGKKINKKEAIFLQFLKSNLLEG